MPAVRYYEVEQTRIVKVRATNPTDAAVIASAALDDDVVQVEALKALGGVSQEPRTTRLDVSEERF